MYAWRKKAKRKKQRPITCNCPHDPTEHKYGMCTYTYPDGTFCECPVRP